MVLGGPPADGPAQLGRVGFVAQDTPTYPRLSVAAHLRMGAWLNPSWDAKLAERRVAALGLDPRQRAGSLSGVQRAQLALTLAVAKRRLSGPRRHPSSLPSSQHVIEESRTDKQSLLLVRTDEPILDPAWTVKPVTLDDLVIAYMSQAREPRPLRSSGLEVLR